MVFHLCFFFFKVFHIICIYLVIHNSAKVKQINRSLISFWYYITFTWKCPSRRGQICVFFPFWVTLVLTTFLSEFMLTQYTCSSVSKQLSQNFKLRSFLRTLWQISVVSVQLEPNKGGLIKLRVLCGYLLDSPALI